MASRIPDHLLSEKQLKKREYNRAHREKLVREKGEKNEKNKYEKSSLEKRKDEKLVRKMHEKKVSNHLKTNRKEYFEKNLDEKSKKNQKSNLLFLMRNEKSKMEEKDMSRILKPVPNEMRKDLTWDDLRKSIQSPKNGTFLFLLLIFSSFLMWQGAFFLMKQGYSQEESYICSIFGELLLIISAGLIFQAETPGAKKAFKFICGLSVFLLGAFLHNGVKSSLLEANPQYQRVKSEYKFLVSDVKSLREDKKLLPESHITKKAQIQTKIDQKSREISAYSEKLLTFESKAIGIGQYYIAWIRIALMLINAYLAHAFLKELLTRG